MDVICRRCREPWEAYYLRHDMHLWLCNDCGHAVARNSDGGWTLKSTSDSRQARVCEHSDVVLEIEPANNGEIPPQVKAWIEDGQPGWLRFVATGRACPYCYGTTVEPAEPLTLAELDDIDAATEGAAFADWF